MVSFLSTMIRSAELLSTSRSWRGSGCSGKTNQTAGGVPPLKVSAIARHVAHFVDRKTTVAAGSRATDAGNPISSVLSSPDFTPSGSDSSSRCNALRISASWRNTSTRAEAETTTTRPMAATARDNQINRMLRRFEAARFLSRLRARTACSRPTISDDIVIAARTERDALSGPH